MDLKNQVDQAPNTERHRAGLPALPTSIRYYDDFQDKFQSIRNLSAENDWQIFCDGKTASLHFSKVPHEIRLVFKHIAADMFNRLDPTTAYMLMDQALRNPQGIARAFPASPQEYREYWTLNAPNWKPIDALTARTAVHSLCNLNYGQWTPDIRDFVSQLASPKYDPYKTVRTQDCFLPINHQSLIIEYLDEMCSRVSSRDPKLDQAEIRDACILVISHQFGFRPGQISRIKAPDVRMHGANSVHIAAPLIKQRGAVRMRLVTRRIKAEWVPLFHAYSVARAHMVPPKYVPENIYFLLQPAAISLAISSLTQKVTGTRWTATDLRHTAAQRLADAGVSHISLSEFMGHATTLTANVYFDASPTQAQRINQALALSPIYSNVVEVARTRTIDKAALLRLSSDQQIGGVPHGIPIAGIGGCSTGQSLCAKNPILSCYTCRKFMPLADAQIHDAVVESLRPVVADFANASRRNEESPAYTQLRRMLDAAQQVAHDIREAHGAAENRIS